MNSVRAIVLLHPWDERDQSVQELAGRLRGSLASIPGTRAYVYMPRSLGVRGDGIHVRVDEEADPFERGAFRFQSFTDELFRLSEAALENGQIHVLLAAEVVEEGRLLDSDAVGDLVELGAVVAVLGEENLRYLENPFPRIRLFRQPHARQSTERLDGAYDIDQFFI